jgi:D-ribulokinase
MVTRQKLFIGVDVGTGSARAGLFDAAGTLLASAKHDIRIWHEAGEIVEQSSNDIWRACTLSVRAAMAEAGASAEAVAGIGFDATCSLVALTASGEPVSVSPSGDPERNIIVWMDHRAGAETKFINATHHEVLNYVGGIISPEMETPKLLWLKKNLPASYHAAGLFFDLADYLTWRATGSEARSICTVASKWTYLAHEQKWRDDYFQLIGIPELTADNYARIGKEIVEPGRALARGLSAEAAKELGLVPGTPVGASLIDAHAGAVGTVGGADPAGTPAGASDGRFAYIMGTSACILATTPAPAFVDGVWGPYFSALVPGLWLNEGGQSAAGAAIDHLLRLHPAHAATTQEAKAAGTSLLGLLEKRITARANGNLSEAPLRARHLHVVPEFLGNRAPLADPDCRAIISGLGLEDSVESLETLYLAGLSGLGYGAGAVVAALNAKGVDCRTMVMSGGASRSALVRRVMADATGLTIALSDSDEPVLAGAAMLGAVAAGSYASLPEAMQAMSRLQSLTAPEGGKIADFHKAKNGIYLSLQKASIEARELMGG